MAQPERSARSQIKEICDKEPIPKPEYNSDFTEIDQGFECQATLNNFKGRKFFGKGQGGRKKMAEDLACQEIMEKIKNCQPQPTKPPRLKFELVVGQMAKEQPSRPNMSVQRIATPSDMGKLFSQLTIQKPTVGKKVEHSVYYFPNKIIGKGGFGLVYEGYHEVPTKKAAVKKISVLADRKNLNREIDILRRIEHRNLIRYFIVEESEDKECFIAMELAEDTLHNVIDKENPVVLKKFLQDTTDGLSALHAKKIVHRDVKPSNILLFSDFKTGKPVAKLADFGISREVSSVTKGTLTDVKGTAAFLPSEAYQAQNEYRKLELKPSLDIFSLGVTYFYTLTKRRHPFSDQLTNIAPKILQGDFNLQILRLQPENCALVNLLEKMLEKIPDIRPTCDDIMHHPFFWDEKKNLEFITDAANELKMSFAGDLQTYYIRFCNKNAHQHSWKTRLCANVLDFIGNRTNQKKYSENSFKSLLEFIRDHDQHHEEWKDSLCRDDVFGKKGVYYSRYFTRRFPELIMLIFTFFQDKYEKCMKVYKYYASVNDKNKFRIVTVFNSIC